MKASIDSAGRIVIPKALRERAGLRPDRPVEVSYRDGVLVLEAAAVEVTFQRKGRLTVAVPVAEIPPLTLEEVEKTRRQLETERS
ncbi:MAG: AbrB/MazE/SpoVT family DNA-binding domain-containing protein [Armatimonadetes bacterium]|nr:AbrB/MazE/SpoVT family DNA-binding domain-containing protein [Armatimonadota bacterium]